MTINLRDKANIDYLLVFLLAAISGMPFFGGDVPLLATFGLAFMIFVLRKDGFHRYFFFILFAFIIIVLLHSLRFNYFPKNTYIGLVVKIGLGYLVVATVNKDFVKYYINMIIFFSVVSFFFFIPLFISESFDNIFNAIGFTPPFEPGTRKSLILYQLNLDRPGGLYRNCGPFWEPAAFGGFLLLALMFNLTKTPNLRDRKNLILMITAISTLSTTVFLLLGILLFFYFFVNQKLLVKIITVPMMVAISYFAFVNIPFLQEKIMDEIEDGDRSEIVYTTGAGHTRLSSAIADYKDFEKYPVIGRGLFPLNFYDSKELATRHNGFTQFVSQFGIVGSLLYFCSIYLSFFRLTKYSSLNNFLSFVYFILLIGMGIAEGYFDEPFFWGLVFLHLVITPSSLYQTNEHDDLKYAQKTYA